MRRIVVLVALLLALVPGASAQPMTPEAVALNQRATAIVSCLSDEELSR